MSKWVWAVLIVLLILGIFFYKMYLENELIKDYPSNPKAKTGLSDYYFWILGGSILVLILVTILMYLKKIR